MDEQTGLVHLGETFRQVRERRRVSIADLAAVTGIDRGQISELEAGHLDPTYDVLLALADGLRVRPSAFMA
jgi:transcriptional regulator with XRE-family HTH domain